jgi:hypothetical protein
MKAVGIDTCVVLRLLVGLPEDQATRAKAFLDACYYDIMLDLNMIHCGIARV